MTFRERLKEEISYNGFVMKEVADRAGLKPRSLEAYCRTSETRMPAADVAVSLAKVLNVTVEYLVTGEDSNAKKNDMEQYRKLRPLMDKLLFIPDEILKPIEAMIDAAYNAEFEKQKKQA